MPNGLFPITGVTRAVPSTATAAGRPIARSLARPAIRIAATAGKRAADIKPTRCNRSKRTPGVQQSADRRDCRESAAP
jgi:hypothetical protein